MSERTILLLVLASFSAVACIAILDTAYRKDFVALANTVIVGFWAWMQAPRREP